MRSEDDSHCQYCGSFCFRRGVGADQLQLNTTYSRATQERIRATEVERRKLAAVKAAAAATRALKEAQNYEVILAAINPQEAEQLLRNERAYPRRTSN